MTKIKTVLYNILCSILSLISIFLASVFISVVCVELVYEKTSVRGFSMKPTINATATSTEVDWDTVYINRFKEIKRTDIVVASVSWNSKDIIKRVVGVPGDLISIVDKGAIYELRTNGELIYTREKTTISQDGKIGGSVRQYNTYLAYIASPENAGNVALDENGKKCIKLNENEYFLMGDNWAESTDSLTHGPVKKSDLVGRVDLIVSHENYSPIVFISYFVKTLFS